MSGNHAGLHFIPGLELAEAFFREAVKPIMQRHYPKLEYTAALIGSGSEVLGFDDRVSTDHHWGPRVMIFLRPADFESVGGGISARLSEELPYEFHGYPTNFTEPSALDPGVQRLSPTTEGRVNHRVEMLTLAGFFKDYLNISIADELRPADWLTLPHQKLRSICAGAVFRDDLGLQTIRARLRWYPHDVWLYVLAACWTRLGQEEHLMGRAGDVGDDIGSALIAARLVRDVMRLAFLMERQYPPYPKWFGSAFAQLECGKTLQPLLAGVLRAASWQEREDGLAAAYRFVAELHNQLGLTGPLPTEPLPFWNRPFRVIHGDAFAVALKAEIRDPAVKAIGEKNSIGSLDLFSDSTDLLEDASARHALLNLYE